MAIGEEEDIFIFSIHMKFRGAFHEVEVEGDEEFRAAKRTAGMARLTVIYLAYNVSANLRAEFLEVRKIGLRHAGNLGRRLNKMS